MRSMLRLLGLCPIVLLPLACSTTKPRPYQERLAEFMRPWEELKRQKAELWRAGWEKQDFVFEGQGTVHVDHWELTGVPGDVYLQARITYENTTDHPVEVAFVWLDVLDAKDHVVGSASARLFNPMGYPFWPGYTYTTTIRAYTNDIHLDPSGWSWTVACEAPRDNDPGLKPVLIDRELEDRRAELAARYSWSRGVPYRGVPLYSTGGPGPLAPFRQGPFVPGENAWR
ncbi:MAG: FxLYD domain-containing protein [Planctomycetota bacterium]